MLERIDALARARRRSRREFAARVKQAVSVFTTAGYGAVAGALYEPLFKAKGMLAVHWAFTAAGLASLAVAIYLAPKGEADDAA